MKKVFLILAAVIFGFGLQQANAQTADTEMYEYKEGQKAYNNNDYAKAIEWWTKAAEKGDDGSMYSVGVMHVNGYGVPQDWQKAAEWFLMAIEKGNSDAMFTLGSMFAANKRYSEAMQYYLMAAEKGDVNAMNKIGNLYYQGNGVSQDYAKALEWFKKAADKGDADGMHSVGYMYFNGYGVAANYAEGAKWFQKAADKGKVSSLAYMGYIYGEGKGVAKDNLKAAEYYTQAAVRSSGENAEEYGKAANEYMQKATGDIPDYVTINGVKWATRNVGNKGEFVPYPQDKGKTYNFSDAQDACPEGWRLPTYDEMKSLSKTTHQWKRINGVSGMQFGSGSNTIFLPVGPGSTLTARILISEGSLEEGSYWCVDPEMREYNEKEVDICTHVNMDVRKHEDEPAVAAMMNICPSLKIQVRCVKK